MRTSREDNAHTEFLIQDLIVYAALTNETTADETIPLLPPVLGLGYSIGVKLCADAYLRKDQTEIIHNGR